MKEVILGFLGEAFTVILDVGWVRRFHDYPGPGGASFVFAY